MLIPGYAYSRVNSVQTHTMTRVDVHARTQSTDQGIMCAAWSWQCSRKIEKGLLNVCQVYFATITASLRILWCWKCSWRKANAVSRACICALNEIIVLQKEVLFSYESVLNQFRFRFSLVQILFPSSFYSWKFCECYNSSLINFDLQFPWCRFCLLHSRETFVQACVGVLCKL